MYMKSGVVVRSQHDACVTVMYCVGILIEP